MKNKLIITVVLFLAIISCEKGNSNLEQQLNIEIVHGNEQTGVYNSRLKDSLVVKVTDKEGKPVAKIPLTFELKAGSGNISPDWIRTDTSGFACVYWTLGCTSDYNELAAYIYDSFSNKIISVTFSATAVFPMGWGKSCGIDYTEPYKTFFRENNGILYLANYGMIYTSNDGGISWQKFKYMPAISANGSITDIQFNSKGWMYAVTLEDGVFYTEDYVTWHQINNGILGQRYPTSILVDDSCLFVTFAYKGLYRSTDNGQFWKEILIDNNYNNGYHYINRHPNGDLYLFDNQDQFWHSTDNGDNWETIYLSYEYTTYLVEDFIIGKDGKLYIGTLGGSISILSPQTYQGTTHYYEGESQVPSVNDIKIMEDIVYFNLKDGSSPGLYSSQNWNRLDLGFVGKINTYYAKSDGTFLIASSDGVYYYNKQ